MSKGSLLRRNHYENRSTFLDLTMKDIAMDPFYPVGPHYPIVSYWNFQRQNKDNFIYEAFFSFTFLCHRSATTRQISLHNVANSKWNPVLLKCMKNGVTEHAAFLQRPHKQGAIFCYTLDRDESIKRPNAAA